VTDSTADPTAIPAPVDSPDFGVAWHYGDPHREQRELASGVGAVDLSHRGVVRILGADRLSWLHSLTTAHLESLGTGESALSLILSPHGHVEHELHVVDDGVATWLSVEPGTVGTLVSYLESMRFMLRVEPADVSADFGVVFEPVALQTELPTYLLPLEYSRPSSDDRYVPRRPAALVGREVIVPRSAVAARVAASGSPAGTWAFEALRVAAGVPRLGLDTDHRTIPHEVGWIPIAVHLAKGCYRGQETVARVYNLGRPPRRLVLLHLDGASDVLPGTGDEVTLATDPGGVVGRVGTVARHFEFGPIALALVKRSVALDAPLWAGSVAAAQETIVVAG
jgi:folate-binding protein YgfZ